MAVMKHVPRSLLPRTLRGRLIAGLVALLAIACATVGLVTYFAVNGALSRELNSQLQTATDLAHNCWENQVSGNREGGGDGDNGQPAGDGGADASPSPAPTSATTPGAGGSAGTPNPFSVSISDNCPGLGEGTFVAVVWQGQWQSAVV